MILPLKITDIKKNLIFVINIVIVAELVDNYLKGTTIFSDRWLYSAFGFAIALCFYDFFVKDIDIIKEKTIKFKKTYIDFVRYAVLFFVSHILTNYFEYGTITFTYKWLSKTTLIIASYLLSDIIFMDYIMTLNNYQELLYEIIKMFLSDYFVILLLYNDFTNIDLIDNVSFLFAYLTWHLTKNFVL